MTPKRVALSYAGKMKAFTVLSCKAAQSHLAHVWLAASAVTLTCVKVGGSVALTFATVVSTIYGVSTEGQALGEALYLHYFI